MGARDDGDRRWCGGAFSDLSTLLICCGPVRFAGFDATLDGSTPPSRPVCSIPKALREETFRVSLKRFFCPPWECLPSKSSPNNIFFGSRSVVCHASHELGPAELGLHQDVVDAGEVCTGEDLGVGNLFLPLDTENPPEAGGVEVVQLPCMPLVDYSCFAAVEKGGEDCSLVYLDLGFGCDASPIPDLFVESAKSGTRFSAVWRSAHRP